MTCINWTNYNLDPLKVEKQRLQESNEKYIQPNFILVFLVSGVNQAPVLGVETPRLGVQGPAGESDDANAVGLCREP